MSLFDDAEWFFMAVLTLHHTFARSTLVFDIKASIAGVDFYIGTGDGGSVWV